MKSYKFFTVILFCLAGFSASAQISGPTPVNVGTSQNYTYTGTVYAEWYWEAAGGTVTSESLVGNQYQVTVNWTDVSTTNTIKLFRVTYVQGNPMNVQVASKTIDVQVPVPTATTNQTQNCGSTTVTRTNNPPTGYEWWWQTDPAGTSTSLGSGTSFNVTSTQALYLRARQTSSSIWSASLQSLGTVTVLGGPGRPFGIADDVVYGSGSVTIVATPQGGDQVKWYADTTGGTALYTGTTFVTPVLTTSTKYYMATRNSTLNCESPRSPVTVTVAPLITPSQVEVEIMRVSGVNTDGQIYGLTNTQRSKQITYFDGMSRVVQQISMASSPGGYDVVQPVEYDALARPARNYMPYVASTSDGSIKNNFRIDQPGFYLAANDKIANDTKPYDSLVYEKSPMARVTKIGSVGAAWQPGTGHEKLMAYTFNVSGDNVRKFKADGTSTTFYAANKLYKTILTDENGNQVITFADDLGRTVLKKVQLDEVINGSTVNWLDTYNVYNDLGQLKYTISPAGVVALAANSWTLSQSIKDQYVYEYVYDVRGRVIEKKVPGQAWMYYGYDDLNRLVLTQDGLLRATNQWLFIKYDQQGRAVMQGLYTNTVDATRSAIQTLLDGLYTSSNPTYGEHAWFEKRGTSLENHTNNSFPKTNQNGSALTILSVNYYDNYDFDNNGTADYAYVSQSLTGSSLQQSVVTEAAQGSSLGRATGSKRIILGTSTWMYSYVFYDNRGRVIQTRSDNHLWQSKEDITTMLYDFEGKIVKRKTFHKAAASGKQVTVINRYEFDTQGRLTKVYQSNDGSAEQLLAKYEYNELGQLVDKKLHGTGTVGSENTFLQSVDYRYTIRGQLASINNAQLTNDGAVNDETNDFFGLELLYNAVESGLSNTAQYNGNISAVKWKSIGAIEGAKDQRSYKFSYDKSDKLELATYKVKGHSAWDSLANVLNESMSYDHNGNIKTLQRYQNQRGLSGITVTGTAQLFDDLTYTYNSANGNSLQKVEDASSNDAGFKNGANVTDEYAYDVNGNITADKNKGIDSVKYNFLGKVSRLKFSDGKVITYKYDAAGVKLSMSVTQSSTTTTTDYVNGFVYEGGNLSFFGSPEGRVVKNGSAYEYQYSIADHLGNTRIVFTSAAPAPVTTSTDFEASSNANFQNYTNRINFELMDHTDFSGSTYSYSQKLTGGSNAQVGVAKSMKVYPGDKVKIEAYAKYYNPQGTASNLSGFALALTSAFGVSSSSTGEALKAYNALNNYGGIIASGNGGGGSSYPKLFVNILLFDKDFNFLDAAWQQIDGGEQVGASPKAAHDYMMQEVTVKEAGYAYVYISNENPTLVEFYVDDVTITNTPSNIIQSNEYYPFGLQTANSWTRENNTGNNFLYNAASELNQNSGWYEMFYRGYDPALGRMLQVDPYASSYSSQTPYNYALNNPVTTNDPSGGNAYNAGMVGRQSTNLAYWNFEKWWNQNVNAAWGTEGGGGGGGGGGGLGYGAGIYYGSAQGFINWARSGERGGSWENGVGYRFQNDGEVFEAGAAYMDKYNLWGKGDFALTRKLAEFNYQIATMKINSVYMIAELGSRPANIFTQISNEMMFGDACPCPPNVDCAAVARAAEKGLNLGVTTGGLSLTGMQLGMIGYRNFMPIGTKIGTFSAFSASYSTVGFATRIFGGVGTYVVAPLSIGLNIHDANLPEFHPNHISSGLATYRVTGTLSSVATGSYVGTFLGGPLGTLVGTGVGLGFASGEIIFNGLVWVRDEISREVSRFNNAWRNGWYPGR